MYLVLKSAHAENTHEHLFPGVLKEDAEIPIMDY